MIEGLGNWNANAWWTGAPRGAATLLLAVAMVAGSASGAAAEEAADPAESVYDKIWGITQLYKDADNPWIQELRIVGRQQLDWYHFDGKQTNADNFLSRRTRLGLKATVGQDFTLHAEMDLNLEGDGKLYNKLTDAYVKWSPDKAVAVTVGKHGAKFTLDGSTSSTKLLTIDRSNLANNFWFTEEYMPGVSFSGEASGFVYNTGIFSAGSADSEFGDFDGGIFLLLSGGYDFAEMAGLDQALLRLDYVWQDPDPKNDFTRRMHEHVASLNFQLQQGRWGLATDIDLSDGYGGQSDLVGGSIMPSVMFCETWQGVLRYTGISSDDPNGIRLARYESRIVSGRGDEYHEIYLGVNKYLYGHNLKWQTGIQYASMDDSANDGGEYDGWGVTTALRASW